MPQKHNKQDLIDTLQALNPELTHTQAQEQVNTVLQAITLLTNEDGSSLMLRHFGTFSRIRQKARKGHNPATLAAVLIPETSVLRFKSSHELRRQR